ncbi:trna ligase [Coemansia brasiliensis]|uniref:Trna ligase n=1 Tax=Coemansia brasiliensis TaxID=2650707 RepID=A0A9W8I9E1_9FUNG|nr:trna ligase [Coemansia brasiliensis]
MNWGPLTREEQQEFQKLLVKMKEVSTVEPASKRLQEQEVSVFASHRIVSWRSTDFLHRKDPCPLPTRARGLFTSAENGEERIVARGYDKFFKIDEVRRTEWTWIESNTHGPFEMTVKEDGCLILAGSLNQGRELLITSKHSVDVPHSKVARRWMEKHLSQMGKTIEDLAGFLHKINATAVFELCDEEFEEQVLEYPERARGLYLHGINRNSVKLNTWPSTEVTKVAEHFGFHKVQWFIMNTIEEGREFADKVHKDQMLDGRAIEGFVVRCKLNESNELYMFKIKYDMPYLMFHEWRNVTYKILARERFLTTFPMTRYYASWFKQNLDRFSGINSQKGLFSARREFIEHYKSTGGSEAELFKQIPNKSKVLLILVTPIDYVKTTLLQALSHLFGFGHVKDSDIKESQQTEFYTRISNMFNSYDFVIMEGSRSISKLQETLIADVKSNIRNCQVVTLYWACENITELRLSTSIANLDDQVYNLLTSKCTATFPKIAGNTGPFELLDLESRTNSLIENFIELNPLEDIAPNLQIIASELCRMFPGKLEQPSDIEIIQALESVRQAAQ